MDSCRPGASGPGRAVREGRAAPELVTTRSACCARCLRARDPRATPIPGWREISWDRRSTGGAGVARVRASPGRRRWRSRSRRRAARRSPTTSAGSSAWPTPSAAPTWPTAPRSATGTRTSPTSSPSAAASPRRTSRTAAASCCGATTRATPGWPTCWAIARRRAGAKVVVSIRAGRFAADADCGKGAARFGRRARARVARVMLARAGSTRPSCAISATRRQVARRRRAPAARG